MHSRSMACTVLILPCLLHSRILKIMPTKATKPTMKCLKQWILKMKIEQRPCEVWETGQTVGYWAGICCDAESLQRNWWGPVTGQLCSYSIDDLAVACCVCARIAQEASQFRSCKKPWCIILLAMLLSLSSKSKGVQEYGSQLTTMNPTCYPKLLTFRFFLGGVKCRSSNRVFSPKKLTISPCVETGCLSAYPFLQELTAERRPALTSLFAYLIYCLHSYLSHMWSEKKSRDLGTFPSSGIDSWWPWKIQTCHLGGWDCQFLGAKSWWYCGGKSFATSACQSNELFSINTLMHHGCMKDNVTLTSINKQSIYRIHYQYMNALRFETLKSQQLWHWNHRNLGGLWELEGDFARLSAQGASSSGTWSTETSSTTASSWRGWGETQNWMHQWGLKCYGCKNCWIFLSRKGALIDPNAITVNSCGIHYDRYAGQPDLLLRVLPFLPTRNYCTVLPRAALQEGVSEQNFLRVLRQLKAPPASDWKWQWSSQTRSLWR